MAVLHFNAPLVSTSGTILDLWSPYRFSADAYRGLKTWPQQSARELGGQGGALERTHTYRSHRPRPPAPPRPSAPPGRRNPPALICRRERVQAPLAATRYNIALSRSPRPRPVPASALAPAQRRGGAARDLNTKSE
ncbi:Protein of unknown function [Gryllus bimaculatus]|nr:Protein of unknown function [Gryllus bimaculatus]